MSTTLPSHPNLPRIQSLLAKVDLPPSTTAQSPKDQAGVSDWLSRLSTGDLSADLESIEKELVPRTFLVGNELSVADVAVYGGLVDVFSTLPPSTYYTLPALTRWFDHIQHHPLVSSAAGELDPPMKKVEFDFDRAPIVERKNEIVKKEKKKDASTPTAAAGEGKEGKAKEGKEGKAKEGKKGKKDKKDAKDASAGGSKPPKAQKAGKAPAAPAPAAEDSTPIPSMIDLRVGHIVDVKKHPDADGLYVEQIDLGEPEGPRTVVSGLVKYVPIEQMKDRWLIAVCNLKPASMRGVKSFAMVLCATSKDGKEAGIEVCEVPEKSRVPGTRVYFEGGEFEGKEPLAQLNPKKKIFEAIQPGFITLDTKECAWKNKETGSVHKIRTKDGYCYAPTLVGASLS